MKTYVFSDEHNCDHTYVLAADAQATVEALRRERDQWKEAFERSCDDTAHLKAALDAEREKVKGLEDKLHAMYANHPEASPHHFTDSPFFE